MFVREAKQLWVEEKDQQCSKIDCLLYFGQTEINLVRQHVIDACDEGVSFRSFCGSDR